MGEHAKLRAARDNAKISDGVGTFFMCEALSSPFLNGREKRLRPRYIFPRFCPDVEFSGYPLLKFRPWKTRS